METSVSLASCSYTASSCLVVELRCVGVLCWSEWKWTQIPALRLRVVRYSVSAEN